MQFDISLKSLTSNQLEYLIAAAMDSGINFEGMVTEARNEDGTTASERDVDFEVKRSVRRVELGWFSR